MCSDKDMQTLSIILDGFMIEEKESLWINLAFELYKLASDQRSVLLGKVWKWIKRRLSIDLQCLRNKENQMHCIIWALCIFEERVLNLIKANDFFQRAADKAIFSGWDNINFSNPSEPNELKTRDTS